MKRILFIIVAIIAVAMAGGVAAVAASPGDKPPAPPGQGECGHGNTGKPCKEDPQPEHGKDCEEHGPKNGGVNEDHCKGETTPTETTPTETTPTTPTETTPTTPTETTPTTPTETTPTTPSTPTETTPTTPEKPDGGIIVIPPKVKPPTGNPVDKPSLEEDLDDQAKANGAGKPVANAQNPDELPYTGVSLLWAVLAGLSLVGTGLKLRSQQSM